MLQSVDDVLAALPAAASIVAFGQVGGATAPPPGGTAPVPPGGAAASEQAKTPVFLGRS